MAKKKFNITLPMEDYKDLQRLAISRGDETATKAAFFVQQGLAELRRNGEIPTPEDLAKSSADCKTIAHLVNRFFAMLIEYKRIPLDRLQVLAAGKDVATELEVARIALCLGIPEKDVELINIKNGLEVKNGNK